MHWTSRLTTLAETLQSILHAGFVIRNLSNITENQMPSWRLSLAHTRLMLEDHGGTAESRERLRRRIEVHTRFARAFDDLGLAYMIMSLARPAMR